MDAFVSLCESSMAWESVVESLVWSVERVSWCCFVRACNAALRWVSRTLLWMELRWLDRLRANAASVNY